MASGKEADLWLLRGGLPATLPIRAEGAYKCHLAIGTWILTFEKVSGNTPWVAPVCADCPGFLVLGSAPAPASTFVSEPQIVRLG